MVLFYQVFLVVLFYLFVVLIPQTRTDNHQSISNFCSQTFFCFLHLNHLFLHCICHCKCNNCSLKRSITLTKTFCFKNSLLSVCALTLLSLLNLFLKLFSFLYIESSDNSLTSLISLNFTKLRCEL